jgi:hypothetical protein
VTCDDDETAWSDGEIISVWEGCLDGGWDVVMLND